MCCLAMVVSAAISAGLELVGGGGAEACADGGGAVAGWVVGVALTVSERRRMVFPNCQW